jgi:hypothetical protein
MLTASVATDRRATGSPVSGPLCSLSRVEEPGKKRWPTSRPARPQPTPQDEQHPCSGHARRAAQALSRVREARKVIMWATSRMGRASQSTPYPFAGRVRGDQTVVVDPSGLERLRRDRLRICSEGAAGAGLVRALRGEDNLEVVAVAFGDAEMEEAVAADGDGHVVVPGLRALPLVVEPKFEAA